MLLVGDVELLLLPHPAIPKARSGTAIIASRFIAVLLLSHDVKSECQRDDDREAHRAGIEIRHVRISDSG